MVVITLSLVDLFDTIGTLVGTAQSAGMINEEGELKGLRKALASDAIATACGAMLGTTTLATVVESSAGMAAGARTGLRSEEHTSELQSRQYLVCRLLLEKKNKYSTVLDFDYICNTNSYKEKKT